MTNRLTRQTAALLALAALLAHTALASPPQRGLAARPTESGGVLSPEQAAYDVLYYDLAVRVDPEERAISGTLTLVARILRETPWIVLDLDEPLTVESVSELTIGGPPAEPPKLRFERRGGEIWIATRRPARAGELVLLAVSYGGRPREAPTPPWAGGFVWSKTADGRPWIGVACQMDGADIWWPCKDHPSDEPEAMALHVTVPEGLVCAANGKQGGVRRNGDGTLTFDWFVSTPINNYGVSINIAPYEVLRSEYTSVAGERVPVTFWVLPEHVDEGRRLLAEFPDYARFLEELLGPYPFRADKIGIAETPYLGMEHQTITAYGANFKNNEAGFDGLLFHELGHEWWGNLVTAADWKDFWIHEGFQSYTDALYTERRAGAAAMKRWREGARRALRNAKPLAPRASRTTVEMYLSPPDFVRPDGDIYVKGAVVLDTLRYVMGDAAFFRALRRMAYPNAALERSTDGSACRLVTTDDFVRIAEQEHGRDLDWFFDVYVRSAELPRLVSERTDHGVRLRWDAPGGRPFPMPVEVRSGGALRRVEMPGGSAEVRGRDVEVDPEVRVLRAP